MKRRPLCAACVALMIAIWLCRVGGIPIFGEPPLTDEEQRLLLGGQPVTVTGLVTERRLSTDTIRYTLRHARVTFRDREIPFSGIFISTPYENDETAAEPGAYLRARGELRPLEMAGNPGQFDAAAYYACQKIYYRLWTDVPPEIHAGEDVRTLLSRLREGLTAAYTHFMHRGPGGILSAMLLGDRAFLTEESRRNFQVGGCLHLLVISGLHVMLLGMGLLKLLRLRLPQKAACVLAAGGMFTYTALTGFPVAAVRAYIMFFVLVLARMLRRTYDSASAMAVAAILILISNPGYLFHAGFQLSFAAAAGAALATPILKHSLEIIPGEKHERNSVLRTLLRRVRENSILWITVQLCTLPLTAYYFFEIPVWSLLMNLLLVPCVQYVLEAGVAGSLAVPFLPRAGRWLLLPADLGLGLFDKVLSLARHIPGNSVVCGRPALWKIAVYYGVLLVVLQTLHKQCGKAGSKGENISNQKKSVLKHRHEGRAGHMQVKERSGCEHAEKRRGCIRCGCMLLAACFILFSRVCPAFSLTMLDVGQGDCLVIQTGRHVFLSDGGSTNVGEVGKYRIIPSLESEGISRLDGVCISHNDADHMNGIEEMLRMIAEKKTALRVRYVYMPAWMLQTEDGRRISEEAHAAGAEVRVLQRGDVLTAGALRIEVLHPFRLEPEGETGEPTGGAQAGNAGSVVLQVTYRTFTALLTGDLEKEGEEELLPYLADIDCLKVGHHGSRWATSKAFLDITRPEVALISAPAKSIYRHPHRETLERLQEAGVSVLITRDRGAVTIAATRDGMRVYTFRE